MRDFKVGLVIYPGAQMSAVLGLTDLFEIANARIVGGAAAKAGRIEVQHGTWGPDSSEPAGFGSAAPPDVVILPPRLGAPITRETAVPMARWLKARHGEGCVLASVCAGAFALAETGLLDGRSATTHWIYAEAFSSRFPSVRLEPDRLIIDEGDIITAGGLMSWTDLGLTLVSRLLGPAVMLQTAQVLLIDPPGREQSYYSAFVPRLNHGDSAILKAQHWLQSTAGRDAALPVLAAKAGLEHRTFLRRFQRATGLTSTEYVQRLRINKARELLQFGKLPVDGIAWEVGYRDSSAFRRVFLKIVGLSPGEYRQRFHA